MDDPSAVNSSERERDNCFYEDSHNVEEWLFQQAKEQGFEKLVEKIKAREENKTKSV